MLLQRCTLDQHRLIIPVSVSKPSFQSGAFETIFPVRRYFALVDTGAQRTVLSRSVISEHGLVRVGHMQFSSLHGPQTHSRYLASIALWAKRIDRNADHHQYEHAEVSPYMIEEPFEIVDMDNNANFDLILGFDILKSFSFYFDDSNQEFQIIVKR